MKKRILSLIVVACMLVSTMSAYAAVTPATTGTRNPVYETTQVHSVTIDQPERITYAHTGYRYPTSANTSPGFETGSPESVDSMLVPYVEYVDSGVTNGSNVYGDSFDSMSPTTGYTITHLSPFLTGASQIIVPRADWAHAVWTGSRTWGSGAWARELRFPGAYEWYIGTEREGEEGAHTGNHVYFSFTPDAAGTLYILDNVERPVYASTEGFETVQALASSSYPVAADTETAPPYGLKYFAAKKYVQSDVTKSYQSTTYAYAYSFDANETVTVPTPQTLSEPPIFLIKWDDRSSGDATLSSLSYTLDGGDAIAIEGFDPAVTEYTVAVDPEAVIEIVAPSEATVSGGTRIPFNTDLSLAKLVKTVTMSDSTVYTITFTPDLIEDHIYNLDVSKGTYREVNSANPDTSEWDTSKTYFDYYVNPNHHIGLYSYGTNYDSSVWYDNYYLDATTNPGQFLQVGVSDGVASSSTYLTMDRTDVTYWGSELFLGQTIIRVPRGERYGNTGMLWSYDTATSSWVSQKTQHGYSNYCYDDYSGQNGAPYWYSFYISSPATVYVDNMFMGASWDTGIADGWTKSVDTVHNRATYSKHFDAGMVNIPNLNGDIEHWYDFGSTGTYHDVGAYYVVWDDANSAPKLSSFTYTANGVSADVTGWSELDYNTNTYNVSLPTGTRSVTLDATPDASTTVDKASQTIDVAAGSGSASVVLTRGNLKYTFTVNFVVEGVHKVDITYTADRAAALKAKVVAVEDEAVAGSLIGQESSFASTYTYYDAGLMPGDYSHADRTNWTLEHVTDKMLGLSRIMVSVSETRNADNANGWTIGSVNDQGQNFKRTIKSETAKPWFESEDGTYFEFTPDAAGTLYIMSIKEAPNYEAAYTKVADNAWPAEFVGYSDIKLVDYDTIIRSQDYYATVPQWTNGYVGQQFTDDTKTEITAYHNWPMTYKYAYKVDFNANEKFSVPVPGAMISDPCMYFIEWADRKVTAPSLDSITYSVDGGEAVEVEGFDASIREYSIELPSAVTSVSVDAVASEGYTLGEIANVEFDENGVGSVIVTVKGDVVWEEYKVTFTKIASDDNTLASLAYGNVKFDLTTGETAFTAEYVAGAAIEAVVNDEKAEVAVDEVDGIGTYKVVVTAENGDKKEYTVNVKSPAPQLPQVSLATLAEGSGTLVDTNLGDVTGRTTTYNENTVFELTATPAEGWSFAYWIDNNSGRIVSEDDGYSFTLVAAKSVSAVFVEESDTAKTVTFKNKNGQIVGGGTVTESTSVEVPADPYYMGYKFAGWKLGGKAVAELTQVTWADVEAVEGSMVVYEAYYEKGDGLYALNLINATASPAAANDESKYAYDTKITVKGVAPAEGNSVFSHWIKDEQVVSYDANYSFFMGGTATDVEAVYVADEASKKAKEPVIIMTDAVVLAGEGKVAFFAERNLYADAANGRVLIETGILVDATGTKTEFGFDDGILKATSTSTSGKGQYTVRKANLDDGAVVRARAYMVYSEGGEIKTVFSNTVEGIYND